MALQSSGQIKMSEINTEFGVAPEREITLKSASDGTIAAINTANAAADRPDGTAPHAISEFYSYNHSAQPPYTNTHYYTNDGVNDYIKGTWSGQTSLHNNDWSISFWLRQNQSSKVSQQFVDWNSDSTLNSGSTTNRVMFNYNGSLNRIMLRIRTNSSNFDRQWALHDNSSVTGITSSATGWTSGQRGNVNSDGFCHLVITYDSSQSTGTNALKAYWNGSELTTQAASNNGSRNSATFASLSLCAAQHSISGGNANIDIDEWAFYNDVLTSSEASTLYNSGTIASPHTLHTNNLSEVVQFAASNSINTYASNYSGSITGGSTNAY